ncbi:MAG: hypothetical protein ABF868_03235 [Sporolactobacillus sp.]
MSSYLFYKEFENGHSFPVNTTDPETNVYGTSFGDAASTFAKRHSLNFEDYEQLDTHAVRAYFSRTRFLKKNEELIYYVILGGEGS